VKEARKPKSDPPIQLYGGYSAPKLDPPDCPPSRRSASAGDLGASGKFTSVVHGNLPDFAGGLSQHQVRINTQGKTPPKFFGVRCPVGAQGIWYGFWGQLLARFPDASGSGEATEEAARTWLRNHHEHSAAEQPLRYCLPYRFG